MRDRERTVPHHFLCPPKSATGTQHDAVHLGLSDYWAAARCGNTEPFSRTITLITAARHFKSSTKSGDSSGDLRLSAEGLGFRGGAAGETSERGSGPETSERRADLSYQ